MKKFIEMHKTRLCAINISKKLTLLGDLNKDYSNYNKPKNEKNYADTISSVGLEQIISYATRDSPMRHLILDHACVQDCMLNKVIIAAVIEHDLFNHFPIVLHHKTSIYRFEGKRSEMRKITPEKIEIFLQSLAERLEEQELQKKHGI